MPKIRPAQTKDRDQLLKLLKELDLYYPAQFFEDFWVVDKNRIIIAAVQLKDYGRYIFLSSLGVSKTEQKKGIATLLLKETIQSITKDIYLYTIQPDFFKIFGFKILPAPSFLPSKTPLECKCCAPEKCVCMLKSYR